MCYLNANKLKIIIEGTVFWIASDEWMASLPESIADKDRKYL